MDKVVNRFKVVGKLTNVDKKYITSKSNGDEYISVTTTISSMIDGKENEYEINFYTGKLTRDKKVSELYESYESLDQLMGKKIEVSGSLRENRYWSDKRSQLVSAQLLAGRFVHGVVESTPDEGTFELEGFIISDLIEHKNKDGEVYRYSLDLGQANYNNTSMNKFTLHVNPEDSGIVRGINNTYEIGQTVNLKGNLAFLVTEVESTQNDVAFGEPVTRVFRNIQKNFYVTTGSNPFKEEGSKYDKMEINTLITSYKAKDGEIEAKAKTKGSSSSAVTENKPTVTKRQASLI